MMSVSPFLRPLPSRRDDPQPGIRDYRATPPLYTGAARLLDWASTARAGLVAKLELMEADEKGLHPFKGMSCGPAYGQRLHAVISALPDDGGDAEADYADEAILLHWADDCFAGMSLKLLLGEQAGDQPHPLQHHPAGKKGGASLFVAFWAVDDDETLQRPDQVRRRRSFATLSAIQQSQILCRTPDFQRWLNDVVLNRLPQSDRSHLAPCGRAGDAFAADLVRHVCRIGSRAELGNDDSNGQHAREIWRALLCEYENWKWGRRD